MLSRLMLAVALATALPVTTLASSPRPVPIRFNADLVGHVVDSVYGKPVAGADVFVRRATIVIARATTDQFGSWRVHNLAAGSYSIAIRMIGFRPETRTVVIGASATDVTLDVKLATQAVQLAELSVTTSPIAVDVRTGDQTFKQSDYQGAPTVTTSQVIQQSIAGAVKAPAGEVHIRGQHAEYTYYVDGLPVPPGISGSLNELFDPEVVNTINFQTGGWDAEYGKRNAAIVNVQTKVPAGVFHAQFTGYAGNFASNGQTITMSGNQGKFGFFVAGTRQGTDLRREPIVADTDATGKITALHNYANDGQDLFGFAKLQYIATDHDLFNLDINLSRSRFATPFDSSAGIIDDRQTDINHFVNLSYQHRTLGGRHPGSEAFAGIYYRHGSLDYVPGATDDPTFFFFPDQTTAYNISEARSFNLIGFKGDYLFKASEQFSLKGGVDLSSTTGTEAFSTLDGSGHAGPSSNSPLSGTDAAIYLQSVIQPTEKFELRVGARYDRHAYPLSATNDTAVSQLSPRIRANFFFDASNTLMLYYGRLFVPTNTEDLRAITSAAAGGGASGQPTVPERADFFEIGLIHRFPSGIVTKLSAYHKTSSPGIDDTQLPGSAITTDVNIQEVHVNGIEAVVEVRPRGPLSGFLNLALIHAYGIGAISGGFLNETPPAQPFDLDHDQRLSSVLGLTYSTGALLVTGTGIYSSGLTNGVTPNYPGLPGYDATQPATSQLQTGLFAFNNDFKVDPSLVVNVSAGLSLKSGNTTIRPQLFVDNLFDKRYILKGAFFSGASYGRPRTFSVRLAVGI